MQRQIESAESRQILGAQIFQLEHPNRQQAGGARQLPGLAAVKPGESIVLHGGRAVMRRALARSWMARISTDANVLWLSGKQSADQAFSEMLALASGRSEGYIAWLLDGAKCGYANASEVLQAPVCRHFFSFAVPTLDIGLMEQLLRGFRRQGLQWLVLDEVQVDERQWRHIKRRCRELDICVLSLSDSSLPAARVVQMQETVPVGTPLRQAEREVLLHSGDADAEATRLRVSSMHGLIADDGELAMRA